MLKKIMQTLNLKLVKTRFSTIKYNQMHDLKYNKKILSKNI